MPLEFSFLVLWKIAVRLLGDLCGIDVGSPQITPSLGNMAELNCGEGIIEEPPGGNGAVPSNPVASGYT